MSNKGELWKILQRTVAKRIVEKFGIVRPRDTYEIGVVNRGSKVFFEVFCKNFEVKF